MTANQIAYAKLREDSRHNLESEEAAHRSARAALSQASTAQSKAEEEARRNREQESINWWATKETARHNFAEEVHQGRVLDESKLHNREMERAERIKATETARSHRESEKINWLGAQSQIRRDEANAQAVLRQAAVSERQAAVAEREAAIKQGQLDYNYSSLAATIGLGYSQLAETARHYAMTEALQAEQQHEVERSHKMAEALQLQQIEETQRKNQASEEITLTQTGIDAYFRYLGALRADQELQVQRENARTSKVQAFGTLLRGESALANSIIAFGR